MTDAAEVTVVSMDEAGNTGENLLDTAQPIYALAAVRLDEGAAKRVVSAALGRTQMNELKFAGLRKSGAGRRNILSALDDAALNRDTAAVVVAHKPWMLAAKLVDELVEPRMLATGRQLVWYASAEHVRMTDVLYAQAPSALGDVWIELLQSFVLLARDYSDERAAAFLVALRRARLVVRDGSVHGVLQQMIDTEAEVRAEFATRTDALDPAIPSVFWQAGHWSERLPVYEIVHDDSAVVTQWAKYMVVAGEAEPHAGLGDPAPAARDGETSRKQASGFHRRSTLRVGDISITLPFRLRGITFAQSHRDDRLQLADLLAGSAAHLYAVATGLREDDTFSRQLQRTGIGRLIQHVVGPQLAVIRAARLR